MAWGIWGNFIVADPLTAATAADHERLEAEAKNRGLDEARGAPKQVMIPAIETIYTLRRQLL
jgi:hypothetical protein